MLEDELPCCRKGVCGDCFGVAEGTNKVQSHPGDAGKGFERVSELL